LDYHVELEGHYYSTPYQLVGKEVEIHYTASTVEILYQDKRVASHAHSSKVHTHSTRPEHRPKSHQQYLEWTPTRMIDWAGKARPFTARLVEAMLAEKPHPEMGYRSALGVISLSRKYGPERVESACTRALRLKIYHYQSVKSILAAGLDSQPLPQLVAPLPPVERANIRGQSRLRCIDVCAGAFVASVARSVPRLNHGQHPDCNQATAHARQRQCETANAALPLSGTYQNPTCEYQSCSCGNHESVSKHISSINSPVFSPLTLDC
jgi:hypothetical protein